MNRVPKNMRGNLIGLAVIIGLAISLTGCLGGGGPSVDTIVRGEVNALLDRLEVAFLTEDVDLALSCYSDPFVVVTGSSETTYTHAQQRSVFELAFALVDYLIYDVINRQIVVIDAASAVATCDIHIKGTNPSTGTIEEMDHVELTIRKIADQWRITKYKLLQVTPLSQVVMPEAMRAPAR